MRKLIILALAAAVVVTAAAQSTRRKVKPGTTPAQVTATTAYVTADTLTNAADILRLVQADGYKKAVASRVESLMLTNRSQVDTLRSYSVDIDYRDESGRQINRRIVTVRTAVPPGQTRYVSFYSWDRQQLFYYKDTPPARKTQRTAWFTVTLTPVSAVFHKP